ncbi:MAG: amidohydrolase family protein [Acidobacteria bacterium]|nr:amidohydrolase family protein [Acidobacteriota bacterium]
MARLAGPGTRRIDLRGRAVVPGLIDNHAHFEEEGAYWTLELRLDGVDSRKQALEMIRAKTRPLPCRRWGRSRTAASCGGLAPTRSRSSREAALIAHTRSNAYLFFRENDLGSIQAGRFADLVVIDRDYLTVPAEQIKDIKPVMTMVGGRVVFDAAAEPPAATR